MIFMPIFIFGMIFMRVFIFGMIFMRVFIFRMIFMPIFIFVIVVNPDRADQEFALLAIFDRNLDFAFTVPAQGGRSICIGAIANRARLANLAVDGQFDMRVRDG